MIRNEFREEKSSLGRILRPVAEVILEKDGFGVEIPMYIDSGADLSMIPLRFGRSLGLRQEEGDTIQEIKGISGAGVPYIIKKVTFGTIKVFEFYSSLLKWISAALAAFSPHLLLTSSTPL